MNWSRKKKPRAQRTIYGSISNVVLNLASHFATQAGAVLTSAYPMVDGFTRGFVRLR
ncbi:MAG: hypothetical protein ACRD3H_06175 [Terriglobales bacterium]